jgi:hypothetical protein
MEESKTLFCPSNFPWARERFSLKFVDNLGTHTQEVRQPFVRHCLGILGWSTDIGLVDGSQIFGGIYCLHLRGTLKIETVSYT